MFQTKDDFLLYLQRQQKFSMKLSLERITRACELLDQPQLKVKSVHVAGTNGKGSTCNYLVNMLMASGYKVGMYISPYIVTFNERIQINGHYISDEALVDTANQIYPIIKQVENELGDELTEFEVITLLSFVYFYNQDCDYVVYEVGLGGRYDATNVIKPLVGAITNISFDHMGVLGNTLEEIAYEKVGIAKEGMKIFTTEERKNTLAVFEDYASKVKANIEQVIMDEITDIKPLDDGTQFSYKQFNLDVFIPMLGLHQVKNALLAIRLYEYVLKAENKQLNPIELTNGLKQSKWGGRLEIISKQPFVIIDGSHNDDGVKKLVETMTYYQDRGYSIKTVFAALKDKETGKMLSMLKSISDRLILTSFNFYRASTAQQLFEQIQEENVFYNEDYLQVLESEYNSTQANELLLITGSLYFIAEVKKYFSILKI